MIKTGGKGIFFFVDEESLREHVRVRAYAVHERIIALFDKPKTGRPRRRGGNASAPGEPPAVDTGTLKRSIKVDEHEFKPEARVGVPMNLQYGLYLERGTSKMGARPYMKPAVEHVVKTNGDVKEELKWLKTKYRS